MESFARFFKSFLIDEVQEIHLPAAVTNKNSLQLAALAFSMGTALLDPTLARTVPLIPARLL